MLSVVRATKNPPTVFLSYSHRDRDAVRRIIREVSEALPDDRFTFWDSSERISPGTNFAADVAKALENSSAMLVFISPNYVQSEWGKWELDFALTARQYADRVISVLIRPTRGYPWILDSLQYIDATEKTSAAGRRIAKALESLEGASN